MYNENKRQQKFGFKVLILLASVSMIIGLAVGGTMAWLTDKTQDVKNTFTTSDVDIELTETKGITNGDTREFKMIPGYTIEKDPKVTVKAVSEKCYLFVKVVESTNFGNFMTYEMAEGWTELTGVDGVYYREVDDTDADQDFTVIKDNKVSVEETVTKADMNGLTEATYPTLTFTAYACQYYQSNTPTGTDTNGTPFTPEAAWNNVKPASSGT